MIVTMASRRGALAYPASVTAPAAPATNSRRLIDECMISLFGAIRQQAQRRIPDIARFHLTRPSNRLPAVRQQPQLEPGRSFRTAALAPMTLRRLDTFLQIRRAPQRQQRGAGGFRIGVAFV